MVPLSTRESPNTKKARAASDPLKLKPLIASAITRLKKMQDVKTEEPAIIWNWMKLKAKRVICDQWWLHFRAVAHIYID